MATQQQSQSNGLGIAGFVISLISLLCLGGLASPLSLIMCAFGMRKEPKGLAIAGLILSIIGTLFAIPIFLFGFLGVILGALGIGVAIQVEAAQSEMSEIAQAIRAVEISEGSTPASLGELDLDVGLTTDPWGNAYVYETTETGWRLSSWGFDEVAGTTDDVEYDGR